jgi:Protein of unknown function (DUF2752)
MSSPHYVRKQGGAVWEVTVATVALAWFRFYPVQGHPRFTVCGFHWITGRPCPLCGMTRALSRLVNGNWVEAIHFNALSPIVLVVLCATLVGGIFQIAGWDFGGRVIPVSVRKNFWSGFLLLFLGYGLLRFFQIVT